MENLRLRRAGYSYKRNYELFLKRYKSLCPVTWPSYVGEAKSGVEEICMHLELAENTDYSLGK